MTKLLRFLTVGVLLILAVSLYDCNPPKAYALNLDVNFDSTWIPSGDQSPDGIWVDVQSTDSCVFSWGVDSIITTYDQLENLHLTIMEGTYQFSITPLHNPTVSGSLIWEWWNVITVESDQPIQVYAMTQYFLVLLDTINTWDFNTGWQSQGYQYAYYLSGERDSIPNNYWPSYYMNYYCGDPDGLNREIEFVIDSARRATIYTEKCVMTQSFGLEIHTEYIWNDVIGRITEL